MKNTFERGFTIFEVLTVIGIFLVMFSIAYLSYHSINNNVALNNSVEEMINTLRIAQNRSISSQDNEKWGLHFDIGNDNYVLYRGDWPSPVTTDYQLEGGIKIISVTDAGGFSLSETEFDRLDGTTKKAEIVIGFPQGDQKTIQLEEIGQIYAL